MKKVFLMVSVFLFVCSCAWATFDENNNQSQEQKAYGGSGGKAEQDQDQYQSQSNKQEQSSKSEADSYSKSSSVAVQGQESKQGNEQITNIGGDDTEVNAPTWPTTASDSNKEERSMYSLFGGLGYNRREEGIRLIEQLKVLDIMLDKKVIDIESYKYEISRIYSQLTETNRPPKLLGIVPDKLPILGRAGRGCNIINICGLAAW